MKKISVFVVILSLSVITASLFLISAFAQVVISDSPFTVGRMVVSERIEDREPVGITETFSHVIEKVYCFLEAKDIIEDTSVSFVWYYGDKEMANVALPLRQGPRWRTYSSKNPAGLIGEWKVELQDAYGNVLKTVEFTVE